MIREIFVHTYKSLLLFGLSLILIRFMGKRTLAQLSPFDLIVIIIMGSAIAIPLEDDKISVSNGVIPVIIMSLLNYLLSVFITKNRKIENALQGTSTVLVKNGEVLLKNMKKERITMADLMILLREKEITNINEIQEASIEPNGKMSVLKKKQMQTVTPKDLGIWSNEGIFPTIVIDQGKVLNENLDKLNVSIELIIKELRQKGIKQLKEIKSAWYDEEGNFSVDRVLE
jgi:uncharacterized membrane protein YcaP (DUF421 family)